MAADPLVWQAEQWGQLQGLLSLDRLPHGLMLVGPAEIGKQQFAQAFARLLLCHAPLEKGACGQCKACKLFAAATHPDFLVLAPDEAGKAIKVDQIRQLGEFAGKTASMGQRRVILVSPAEAMNLNAANAFLKTLEEPGDGVVLLLVVHQPGMILPTIRSRCRLLNFPLPPATEVAQWLRDAGEWREEDIERAAGLSGGRPLRAMRLLNSELNDQLALFEETLAAVESRAMSPLDAARVLQTLAREDAVEWFQYQVYRLIRSQSKGRVAPAALFRFLDRLTAVRQRLLGSANPNPQLVWEELLMDWASVIDLSR